MDLAAIRRATDRILPPPGMDRDDLFQSVVLSLLQRPCDDEGAAARHRARSLRGMALRRHRTAEAVECVTCDPDTLGWGEILALLPWRERTAVDLHYRLGMEVCEVAVAMQLTKGGVDHALRRARKEVAMACKKKGKKRPY